MRDPFSPALVICCLFDTSHFDRCEIIILLVLICISLMTSDIEYFSCVYWSSLCLLWKKVYLDFLLTYKLGGLFLDVELYELFVYFVY